MYELTKVNLQRVNDLRGVQVGDRLYHIARGWGTVTTVFNSKFRMEFKGRDGDFEYYFNGVSVLDDSAGNASVCWSVPTIIPPARLMKVDTPVAILTASGEHLYFAHVQHQNEQGDVCVFPGGRTSLTSSEGFTNTYHKFWEPVLEDTMKQQRDHALGRATGTNE